MNEMIWFFYVLLGLTISNTPLEKIVNPMVLREVLAVSSPLETESPNEMVVH